MWKAVAVIIVMVVMLILLYTEVLLPHMTLLLAFIVVWSLGIVTTSDAIKGFSNEALVTVGSLFIVVKAVDRAQVVGRISQYCLGEKTSMQVARVRFCLLVFVLGWFMPNVPLIALLMPIIRDWARKRSFAPSKFLIPLAYSSIAGGMITIIGGTTNLMICGMLRDATGETFGFFEPGYVGFISSIFSLLYLYTVGCWLLPDNKGGLFRALKKKKKDMVTELQVSRHFPLVGSNIFEAMDDMRIPREALLKIYRQPHAVRAWQPMVFAKGRRRSRSGDNITEKDRHKDDEMLSEVPRSLSQGQFERLRKLEKIGPNYLDRTAHCWGKSQRPLRPRAVTEPPQKGCDGEDLLEISDPQILEIFPVPEREVLAGGDILLFSLPQEDCISLVKSRHVMDLVSQHKGGQKFSKGSRKDGSEDEEYEEAPPLRICDVDLLEVPGRDNDFVELVVSRSNPFVNLDLRGQTRVDFEKRYEVAVLAVRHNPIPRLMTSPGDHLPSKSHGRQVSRQVSSGHRSVSFSPESDMARERASSSLCSDVSGSSRSTSEDYQSNAGSNADEDLGVPEGCLGGSAEVTDTNSTGEQEVLRAGDTLLVLAKSQQTSEHFLEGRDFLAATAVAKTQVADTPYYDYIPLLLFLAGVICVAARAMTMVHVSMLLALIVMLGGWVPAGQLRQIVDWNLLILIGSALGLAQGVKASGLSRRVANAVIGAHVGPRGTVFLLYLFVCVLTELVTNNAAAALGFPLALDLAGELGLASAKPLCMTVLLAASTCYVAPISSPVLLMVMGPGGYKFSDFAKVGIGMDIVLLVANCVLIPSIFPFTYGPGAIAESIA